MKDNFSRLFILSKQQDAMLRHLGSWEGHGDGTLGREDIFFFVWEDDLLETLQEKLNAIYPKVGISDMWCLEVENSSIYSAQSAYNSLHKFIFDSASNAEF